MDDSPRPIPPGGPAPVAPAPGARPLPPRRRWWVYARWIVIGVPTLILGLLVGASLFVFTHQGVFTGDEVVDRPEAARPFGWPLRLSRRVNVLLIGVDVTLNNRRQVVNVSRADTLMLISFDPQRDRISGVSIPRDTRAAIPGVGTTKINAAYAFGGPGLTVRAVEDLVGVPVQFYVKLGPESFARFIDAIGGVEIDVDRDMKYTDRWAGLQIDLKKGRQLLTGEQAMGFARFRYEPLGDIARVQRQQKVLLALFQKLKTPETMLHAPQLLRAFVEHTQTNLTMSELITLGVFTSRLHSDAVTLATLPGTFGPAFWEPDLTRLRATLTQLFYGVTQEALASTAVEVLNGSGVPGLARQTAQRLERLGFRVVRVDTAPSVVLRTVVIDRTGRPEVAQLLAELLGSKPITREPGGDADITVVVARDLALRGTRAAGR